MSPKPAGSRIEEVDQVEGVTYQWNLPDPKILRWLAAGVAVVQISIVFGLAIPDIIGQARRQGAIPAEAFVGMIIFGVFGLLGAVMFYFLLRKGLPNESCSDGIRFDTIPAGNVH